MKKSGLIKLICSLVAALTVVLAGVFISVFKDVSEYTKPTLEISSAAGYKIYDGTPLVDGSWTLNRGELKKGHRLSVTVTGTQTNVGISENYISVCVLDKNGADVSSDYNIVTRPGALNVKQRSITVKASSAMKVYDGEPLMSAGYKLESPIQLVEGHSLTVTVEGHVVGNPDRQESAPNNVTNVKIVNRSGQDVTKNYAITTVPGTLTVYTKDTIVVKSDSARPRPYNGKPLTDSDWEIVQGKSSILDGHSLEVEVTGSRTEVGTSENTMTVKIVDASGYDVSDYYDILTEFGELTVIECEITITPNSKEKVYDGKPLTDSGYTVSSEHFSASNLKANFDFAVVISGSQIEVGSSDNIVESYEIFDKYGNRITDNFAVTKEKGTLTVYAEEAKMRPELVFSSESDNKKYDGKPLTNSNWTLESGEILPGHRLEVTVTGSITEVGVVDNNITVRILDNASKDVTDEYIITEKPGELEVTKASVTVTSATAQKLYDGDPLTDGRFTVSGGFEEDGFIFEPEINGSQTAVGSSPNSMTGCKVFISTADKGLVEVTENFEIERKEGTLTVLENEEEKKTVLIYSSGSDERVYDGTPLTNDVWKLLEGEIRDGHYAEVKLDSSITDVGKTDNAITVTIFDSEGVDVTELYYIIEYQTGILEITPVKIVIASSGATKDYDGTPLTNPASVVTPESAIPHKYQVVVVNSGSVTVPDSKPNTISSWTILDKDGQNVSRNFEVVKYEGILTVFPREITITSGSDEKPYDGEPLTCDEFEVGPSDGLCLDHYAEVKIIGSVTDPGTLPNTIDSWKILTYNGEDVTGCYDVTPIAGTLTVYEKDDEPDPEEPDPEEPDPEEPDPEEPDPDDPNPDDPENPENPEGGENGGGQTGDGSLDLGGEIGGGGSSGSDRVYFVLSSDKEDRVYLKIQSFGDFNETKNVWNAAPEYGSFIEDEMALSYLTALALKEGDYSTAQLYVIPNAGYFALPYYYLDGSFDVQKSDVYVNGDGKNAYTVNYYDWDGYSGIYHDFYYWEEQTYFESFVDKNYTDIDDETLAFMRQIIAENGFSADDPDIIAKVAHFIQTSADYNLDYDKRLDKAENVAIAFLRDFNEGICQHYATAATLLFRALGIPARYTVGFYGHTVPGERIEVTGAMYHAWVEVYVTGIGWVNVEVTGSSEESEDPNPDDPDDGGAKGFDLSGSIAGNGACADYEDTVFFTVTTDTSGMAYLKIQSYGDYGGHRWLTAPSYTELVNGYSATYLPGLAISDTTYKSSTMTIDPVGGYFALPYYIYDKQYLQSEDTLIERVANQDKYSTYSTNYYSASLVGSNFEAWGKYADFEELYADYVRENYTDFGDDYTRQYILNLIQEQGFDKITDKTKLINSVATYMRTKAAKYNLEYNRRLDEEKNIAVAFLSDYKEGVCRHFASAATLIYRALGIPARYTVGFASHLDAKKATDITGAEAHAWVEIYIDGIGWVYVEVTGSGNSATDDGKPIKFTVTPSTTRGVYSEGEVLLAKNSVSFSSSGDSILSENGYTYGYTVDGEISALGLYEDASRVTYFWIKDAFDELVYEYDDGTVKVNKDGKFEITFGKGDMQLYISELTFKSDTLKKEYDGIAIVLGENNCYHTNPEALASGYTVVITPTATLDEVGEINSTYDVKVYKNGVDCTDHYLIRPTYGKLTMTARKITVTSASAEKVFDVNNRTPLTAKEAYITSGELAKASGDKLEYTITASQTMIGECDNKIDSIVIRNNKGQDVTKNYIIEVVYGKLTVTNPNK